MIDQPELFTFKPVGDRQVPEPPTGPPARVPSKAEGSYSSYLAWIRTEDGRTAWRWILERARELAGAGATRLSINFLVEKARGALGIPINNTYRAFLADDLVTADPRLLDIIERRRRKAKA